MRSGTKLTLVGAAIALAGVLIGLYTYGLTQALGSPAYTVPVRTVNGHPVVDLEIQTVAAVGPQLSSNPDWVSYLVHTTTGGWKRETVWNLPANATVNVTIYNFDGQSGLRNPLFGKVLGVTPRENGPPNTISLNGKPTTAIDPDTASHVFAVSALGVVVPIRGVDDNAKNQCGYAPCDPTSMAHETIQFTFHTTKAGHYRWQCFVPCAAGWIDGWGGPMQTIGYMDGFLNVKA